MTGDEHDLLSTMLGEDAWATARTAEEQLDADWAIHSARRRHRDRSVGRAERAATSA